MSLTPQRWICGRDSEGDWQIHRHGSEGEPIAIVRAEAPARLMTAAPELLAALKLLMQAYESVLPGLAHIAVQDYALINDAPLAAVAAIAKAEGRS